MIPEWKWCIIVECLVLVLITVLRFLLYRYRRLQYFFKFGNRFGCMICDERFRTSMFVTQSALHQFRGRIGFWFREDRSISAGAGKDGVNHFAANLFQFFAKDPRQNNASRKRKDWKIRLTSGLLVFFVADPWTQTNIHLLWNARSGMPDYFFLAAEMSHNISGLSYFQVARQGRVLFTGFSFGIWRTVLNCPRRGIDCADRKFRSDRTSFVSPFGKLRSFHFHIGSAYAKSLAWAGTHLNVRNKRQKK